VLGRGSGTVIGGRVALRLAPAALAETAGGRRTVLVTGTNGKSTVTALVAAALGAGGSVVSNTTGANMPDGIVLSVAADRTSLLAALEVDEVYLGPVSAATAPRAVVVLNAFREYTRGVSLARTLEHWRSVAATLPPQCSVIINGDDPLVCWAFEDAPRVVPVAGDLQWRADAVRCPACGALHEWVDSGWACPTCGRRRPRPHWAVVSGTAAHPWQVVGPGSRTDLDIAVPGRTGPIGGAFALAAADALGVPLAEAARRIAGVSDVDGRYLPFPVAGRAARLLMLKNPAGWAEAIDLAASTGRPLVLAVDPFGPRDTTTMWEAPFERLAGRTVAVTGGRRADVLAVLEAVGAESSEFADAEEAVAAAPRGEVVVACNYPAFRRLSKRWREGSA
jgi:UDP-N-acetylmuramyl tripeptide synthase